MTEYKWLPRATEWVDVWGCDAEMIEAVVENPQQVRVDPEGAKYEYPVKRYRRGSLEVTVGLQQPDQPMILFIHLHLPIDSSSGSPTSGGSRKKAAAKAPNGLNDFKARIHAAGYTPRLKNGHIHVEREDGSLLMVTSSTPGDKMTITNAWQKFIRLTAEESARQSLQKLKDEIAGEGTTPSVPED